MKTNLEFGSSIVSLIHLSNRLQELSAGGEDIESMYQTVLEIREISGVLKEMMRKEYDR